MGRIDRYLLRQLTLVFNFFGLVLVLVYWINAAVRLFDQLIADGQSATAIGELLILTLPGVIRIVVPIAAFAASVYVTNRLSQDSELVVVQATGFSPWRLARPAFYFGVLVLAGMSVLVHLLVPLSASALSDRQTELAQSITARLLTEGQFIEPSDAMTIYIREISPEGELRDVFLSDMSAPDTTVTYTAGRAYLVRSDDRSQLVMLDGMAQSYRVETGRLVVTTFDDFSYDLGDLITRDPEGPRSLRQVPTHQILANRAAIAAETGATPMRIGLELHERINQSLLGLVGALLGFSALLAGGFSRFGLWPRVVMAVVLIVIIKSLETVGFDLAAQDARYWPAAYLSIAAGLGMVAVLLFIAARPYLLHRSPRVAA
ncbi:LPS export ABC transporter permease LptF [Salipiger sp. IMCC34102]|uniref:LPS export ABC transporter permease LptF n=1 Tax=Salipiger sp. IMCC34102 TaxID=2510647 RepID=UPI00101C8513|nr:LPS export ABC transporter permease LptF [Salipiger sp. IMCC34102]RYH03211.1 LPS export ABC transporter permease LptF [Salipiger sp. IMCC34102]